MICEASEAEQVATARTTSFAYAITAEGRVTAMALDEAEARRGAAKLTWLHIDGNDMECRAWLRDQSGLPAGVIQAMEAVETRPRATQLAMGAIVNLRGVGSDPKCAPEDLVSVRLWAEHGRVLTLTFRSLAAIADLRVCVEEGRVTDPGDFIAALADTLTAKLDPMVSDLGDALDTLEEEVAVGKIAVRDRLGDARRMAIELRRFIAPQKEAIAKMVSGDFAWLNDDDRAHIREAGDRVARMSEELDAIRERAAVLADQLSDLRAEAMNARALVLSIVAAIFLPLTFLTGLFGMNVGGIPFAEQSVGFWAMAGVSVVLGLVLVAVFQRLGWFD